jgi:SEC-C motif domain protein
MNPLICPCGSAKDYAQCCGPIIAGTAKAETAEALMRARYSAYVKCEVDFLLGSLHPDGSGGVDRESTKAWAQNADWHGLEVLSTAAGGEKDETGEVEFVAKYSLQDEPQRHHERAMFKRHNGQWLYLDGTELHPAPVVGPRVRLGRNDACLCGSSQKFKKCCRSVFDSGATSPEALVRARFVAPLVGEARFLARSLHPDAVQASGTADEDPPSRLEIIESQAKDDVAQVVVALYGEDKADAKRERQTVKRVKGKWLFAKADPVVPAH